MADENSKYIPYSFLYILTNNYRADLLAQQAEGKWWSVSGDKFYDTAVALLPFQNEQPAEKTNSQDWLTEVQGTDGCWQGNLRDTAFLLYSVWPKKSASVTTINGTAMKDCEDSGYSCMSSAACLDASGNVLIDYGGCFGTNVCCSREKLLATCSSQNGELCSPDEKCLGGAKVSSSDSEGGKFCCVDGTCGVQETSACTINGGICKSSCSDSEEQASYSCETPYVCCISKPAQALNILVIVILSILIVLVLIGIFFRKKLRDFFFRIKLGKGKGKPPLQPGSRFPPVSSQRIYPGAVQRRIIPAQQRVPVRRPQGKSEFDEVLKKLKDIGK
jgi:hypothetical protein